MPCMELHRKYLAIRWQAKENVPDLKDASTFGRVIRKVFPNVTKTKRRTERGKPPTRVYLGLRKNNHPPVCDSFPPERSFPSWFFFALDYSLPEWFKSSVSANAVEFIRVVTVLCNGRKVLQEVVIFKDWSFERKLWER